MNIRLSTRVKGNYKEIIRQFDRDLFEKLSPKMTKLEIVEFTGSKKGDRVHLRFHNPFRADWVSEITEDGMDEDKAWFVDEGAKLPFGLSFWKHIHLAKRVNDQASIIIDDIHFKGKNWLHTFLLYPILWVGFYARKKVYRNYFG